MESANSRREIQSVRKALSVLECVTSHSTGISLADTSREVGINRNTVFQILNTLCSCGYLFQDPSSKGYFPGTRLIWLCNANDMYGQILHLARPILTELARETGETAHLAVRDGVFIRFLDKVESPQSLAVMTNLDVSVEAQVTSVGKALLFRLPENRLEELIAQIHFAPHTEHSICTPEGLREELTLARACGYAKDDEEHFLGVRCVAAPVTDAQKHVLCAIGISAPKSRMPDFDTAAGPVLRAAAKLQQELCGGI